MRELRTARGLSQEALAREARVSLNLVNKLERGVVRDPHYSTVENLAHALHTTVAELVGEPVPKALARPRSGSAAEPRLTIPLEALNELEANQLREMFGLFKEGRVTIELAQLARELVLEGSKPS
jgi:transcriptional regulator with XRE-family HTH domain